MQLTSSRALIRHIARLMPWAPLLTGCLAGLAMTAVLWVLARRGAGPDALSLGLRGSFIPLMAGAAFLLHDANRQLTTTLPARAWLTPALRVALALPVLAATAAAQLAIASQALRADLGRDVQEGLRFPGQAAPGLAGLPGLPWLALAAEAAAWCAVAIALAAALERTRWQDQAGLIAALGALALVAAATQLPLHLIGTTLVSMDRTQQDQWTRAWQLWSAAGIAACLVAVRAAGDPWPRMLRRGLRPRAA